MRDSLSDSGDFMSALFREQLWLPLPWGQPRYRRCLGSAVEERIV